MSMSMTAVMTMAMHGHYPRAENRMTTGVIVGHIALHPSRSAARAMEFNIDPRRAAIVASVCRRSSNHGGAYDGKDAEKFLHDGRSGFTGSDDTRGGLFESLSKFFDPGSNRRHDFPWRKILLKKMLPLPVQPRIHHERFHREQSESRGHLTRGSALQLLFRSLPIRTCGRFLHGEGSSTEAEAGLRRSSS